MSFPRWALDVLCCPHCGGALSGGADVGGSSGAGAVVGCEQGHRFDVARQGYLPLLGAGARTDTGDDAAMVAARERFLAAGHFAPIAREVAAAAAQVPDDDPIVELGAGTGYYLAAAAAAGHGVAIDSSKYALRRAARQSGCAAILADAWSRLPLRSASFGAALSIFAPRDPAELWRILKPGGRVVAVTPEPDHLRELRDPIGLLTVDSGKVADLVAAFETSAGPSRVTAETIVVRYCCAWPRSAAQDAAAMGPAARHVTADELARRVATLPDRIDVTVAVSVTVLSRIPRARLP